MATPVGKHSIISEALNYRLSLLTLSPVRRVAFPDRSFAPIDGETYIRAAYIPNQSDFGAVGSSLRRHVGLYQVDVVGPTNAGPVPQLEVVDAVIEHFVGQNIVRNSKTIRIGAFDGSSGVPSAAPELIQDGWRTIPITIPWWCDTF